jgi:hypothetical protein
LRCEVISREKHCFLLRLHISEDVRVAVNRDNFTQGAAFVPFSMILVLAIGDELREKAKDDYGH